MILQHTSVVDGRNLSSPKVYTIAVPEGNTRLYVSSVGGIQEFGQVVQSGDRSLTNKVF